MPPVLKFDRRSLALLLAFALPIAPAEAKCSAPLAVEILGSGGPDANDARASSGYIIWIDGKARLLVDAGGGIFLRFGEAKAKFETLDAIAITHLHADHVVDLIALLKSGFFSERKDALPVIGPSGNDAFPGISEFMQTQFNPRTGAYRYLSGYLDGSQGLPRTPISEIKVDEGEPKTAFSNDKFKITAIGVKHGPVPALGYVVEVRGKHIAFSGDQNGDNPAFAKLIKDADILIMDHAVPEAADEVGGKLHARPSEIGALASSSNVGKLVLSHNMARSLKTLKPDLILIKQHYKRPVIVAEDLKCVNF